MPDILLKARNISKKFLLDGTYNLHAESREFYALRDISFDLHRGEVIGVIGENGSGKTTLLKILSEIFPPTSGTIEYSGRITSILEMGTGFHPDLSGKENIFLNGAILGMNPEEISGKFRQIADFSGIGTFIDAPVKHYSTGMYVRLAFSVSVFLETEILLLDEIVSVGDAEFRLKSLEKLREKVKSGISVILASHNLNDVVDLCNKCILLKEGKIAGSGDPVKITREYYQDAVTEHLNALNSVQKVFKKKEIITSSAVHDLVKEGTNFSFLRWDEISGAPGNDQIRLTEISVNAAGKEPEEKIFYLNPLEINIKYRKYSDNDRMYLYVTLFDQLDNLVFESGILSDVTDKKMTGAGIFHSQAIIPASWLNYGMFSIGITFITGNKYETVTRFPKLIYFTVLPAEQEDMAYLNYYTPGPLRPKLEWKTTKIK